MIYTYCMGDHRWNLNRNQTRFVAEYMGTMPRNATLAYQRVYGSVYPIADADAQAHSSMLLAHPGVNELIKEWEMLMARGTRLTVDDFHDEIRRVAMADARDITGYWVGACRYCYGNDHLYQRTPAEYRRDLTAYKTKMEALGKPDPLGLKFDVQGGIGFNNKRPAHPTCPECFGDGEGYERINDTRHLSPGAARLFDGVKRTKDGIEIKTRSRDKHLAMLGNALGVLKGGSDDGKDKASVTIVVEGGLPSGPAPAIVPPAGTADTAPGAVATAATTPGAGE